MKGILLFFSMTRFWFSERSLQQGCRKDGTQDLSDGSEIIVGAPDKKLKKGRDEEGLFIDLLLDRFEIFRVSFLKGNDPANKTTMTKGNPDPMTRFQCGLYCFRDLVGIGLREGQGDNDFSRQGHAVSISHVRPQ